MSTHSAAGRPPRRVDRCGSCAISSGRLGFFASLLSRPVVIGYLAGIAVLMIISQLGKITRIDAGGDSIFEELRSVATQLDQTDLPTLALAVGMLLPFLPLTAGSLVFLGP